MTAFDAFLTALEKTTDREGVLGDESIEYPPSETVDYWATPQNAVVFGWMGVDGVHYAILKIDGKIRDESPVIQVGPMDFDEPYSLLAPAFADYLAIGCATTRGTIEDLIAAEQRGQASLLEYLRSHFKQSRFWTGKVDRNIGPYLSLIVPQEDGES